MNVVAAPHIRTTTASNKGMRIMVEEEKEKENKSPGGSFLAPGHLARSAVYYNIFS